LYRSHRGVAEMSAIFQRHFIPQKLTILEKKIKLPKKTNTNNSKNNKKVKPEK
jgi:hypothetical protein